MGMLDRIRDSGMRKSMPKMGKTSTGVGQLYYALKAKHVRPTLVEDERHRWDSTFVQQPSGGPRRKMAEFGYRSDEIWSHQGHLDDVLVAGPMQLLSAEGVAALKDVCARLETYAVDSSFIVTRRLRMADSYSPFIHNMIRDKSFLLACSKAVGVPLIPHPLRTPTVQINYFHGGPDMRKEVAKWHKDGMDYVFTIQLDDSDQFEGGRFRYFLGRTDEFDRHRDDESKFADGGFAKAGDGLFIHGSKLYHAVTPVTEGRRTTFVFSLLCPYFHKFDSNTFWHLAADDGVATTVKDWLRLKAPTSTPERELANRSGSPMMSWSDLA